MVYEPASVDSALIRHLRSELDQLEPTARRRAYEEVLKAALSSVPWVGNLFAAALAVKAGDDDLRTNRLMRIWIEELERKWAELQADLAEITNRYDALGDEITERITSPGYLSLVRGAVRVWDESETAEKRRYAMNLIVNAASPLSARSASDDVVRLFIDLLRVLHESHLAIVRHLYHKRSATRLGIWKGIYGSDRLPKESSAHADLYRKLFRDLSTGDLIRQRREATPDGRFLEKERGRDKKPPEQWNGRRVIESSFDDDDVYVLTSLGEQFVHYVLDEAKLIDGPRG